MKKIKKSFWHFFCKIGYHRDCVMISTKRGYCPYCGKEGSRGFT
jgi:hypothetical protein